MIQFMKKHPWIAAGAILLTLGCLYFFGCILFLRIMFAPGLVWDNIDPPQMVPAWYYIPQYVVINSPLLILAALPWVALFWYSRLK